MPIYQGFEEKKIFIRKLEVNYKIVGQGPTILILHGWGGNSDSWVKVMEILAGKGYRVICPDFPGFGKSITPAQAWGIDEYVDWLKNFIDLLNIDRFFLLGHSFGGRIAIRFATKYPEKIIKLILSGSAGIKPQPDQKTRITYFLARIGNALFTAKILRRFKDSARNLFYVFLRRKDYIRAKGVMRETIKKVLEEDLLPDLSKIKTKTLIIWGEKDRMVPVKYAYIFKKNIQDSELEILPKIGHSPHLEAPKQLSEIILQFLRS